MCCLDNESLVRFWYDIFMTLLEGIFIFLGVLATLIFARIINLFPNFRWPIMPGDFFIKKFEIEIYVPVGSAVLVSVVLIVLKNKLFLF